MPAKTTSHPLAEREKLLYFVMLRQAETSSPAVRDAYQRLADAASEAAGWAPGTVILDWLESELRSLQQIDAPPAGFGSQLLRAAAALSSALKQ